MPDLRPYEATPDMDLLGMTEVERQIEGKCDVERYWALHHKEDQVELFRGNLLIVLNCTKMIYFLSLSAFWF